MKSLFLTNRLMICAAAVLLVLAFAVPAVSVDKADPRKERLLQRVKDYYDLRVADKRKDDYPFYDPFFRSRVTLKGFESSLIDVKFLSYQIGDVAITENIAKVPVEIEFEIPETVIAGQKIAVPRKKDSWVDDWIWIDNDWFKVYKLQLNATYIPFFPSFPP